MIVTKSDVEELKRLDMSDFAAEVERLIGTELYQKFVRAGKGMQDICNDILQMINERSQPLPHEQLVLFKEKAAQN